jgi:hypothetical protein
MVADYRPRPGQKAAYKSTTYDVEFEIAIWLILQVVD